MGRLLVLALTLVSLDTGQSADLQWQPLCGRNNDDRAQLYMDAEIVARIETETGLSILVNNKQRDVSVKCLTPGKLSLSCHISCHCQVSHSRGPGADEGQCHQNMG